METSMSGQRETVLLFSSFQYTHMSFESLAALRYCYFLARNFQCREGTWHKWQCYVVTRLNATRDSQCRVTTTECAVVKAAP